MKNELISQNNQNKIVEKIENAREAEDYKNMQSMLKPLDAEHERREKVQRTLNSQA